MKPWTQTENHSSNVSLFTRSTTANDKFRWERLWAFFFFFWMIWYYLKQIDATVTSLKTYLVPIPDREVVKAHSSKDTILHVSIFVEKKNQSQQIPCSQNKHYSQHQHNHRILKNFATFCCLVWCVCVCASICS